jgi:hypothetical protein
MAKDLPQGTWRDPRSGIRYLRRKIPAQLRPFFGKGEFYKVTLETAELGAARAKLKVAVGEYERKLAEARAALASTGAAKLSHEQALDLAKRYLTARDSKGFGTGAMRLAYMLIELDDAVSRLEGTSEPTFQEMGAEAWLAYRRQISGSDDDSELEPATLARLSAEAEERHRAPGEAWLRFQRRHPRPRWRPLLGSYVAAVKLH